jgi:hypothetical protein
MTTRNPDAKLTGDRNECPGCNELFNSSAAFDKHRVGPFGEKGKPAARRCLTVAEMQKAGMAKNSAAFWVTALMPQNDPRRSIRATPLSYPQGG